jgi:hypothetical protein
MFNRHHREPAMPHDLLDPFGKKTSSPDTRAEIFKWPQVGGGGGSRKKTESVEPETESEARGSDTVQDKPPPKATAVLSDPQWENAPAYLNKPIGISAQASLPADISHITRVVFTVFAKLPDGKPERIDSQEGHIKEGKAEAK